MMLLLRVLIFCTFIAIIQGRHPGGNIKVSKRNRTQILGVAEQNGTIPERIPKGNYTKMEGGSYGDIEQYKWLATLFDWESDFHICFGAVLNMYWIVTPAYDMEYYAEVQWGDQDIVVDIAPGNYDTPQNPSHTRRYVQDVIIHPDYDGPSYLNSIALVRICPSVSSDYFASLPPPGTTYSTGDTVEYLNHNWDDEDFEIGVKEIGEVCECDIIDEWDPDQHICIEESLSVYLYSGDYGFSPIVIDGYFTGFVLEVSYNSGELGINVAHFNEIGGFIDSITSDISWLLYE